MAMLINIKVLERQYRESTHPIILCSDDDDDKENKFGNSLFAVEGTKLTNPIQSIVVSKHEMMAINRQIYDYNDGSTNHLKMIFVTKPQ
ncbi:hypothetical protein BLOT_001241 [Blomia tropicalis]|nr:hypothetical protein BLOT_001241 [Blomia tropicalis]